MAPRRPRGGARRRKARTALVQSQQKQQDQATPFRFFDLPGELRDMIYDHCLMKVRRLRTLLVYPPIQVKRLPPKALKLVSRQFKRELMAKAQEMLHVVMRRTNIFTPIIVPLELRHLRYLEVAVRLYEEHPKLMPGQLRAIQISLHVLGREQPLMHSAVLPNLKTCSLDVYVVEDGQYQLFLQEVFSFQHLLVQFQNDERFLGLNVYIMPKTYGLATNWLSHAPKHAKLVMAYSQDTRMVQQVEEVEE